MATTTERLPGARIALQIEVDQARVDKHMDRAVSRISKQVRIPGFRPGKADRKTVERHIGTAAILQEALEELVPEVYNEALEEQQIDAIDQPEFELESTDPLVVKATVPVRPEVDLGDYQALRVPKETIEVTEDQVQQTIEQLRRQFAVLEPVDR
ncbi:MAG: trigger factor family protein, partial [Dehalococcoidia bacterium]